VNELTENHYANRRTRIVGVEEKVMSAEGIVEKADTFTGEARECLLLKIRLFDESGRVIPNADYRLTVGKEKIDGTANDGWVEKKIKVKEVPDQCLVEWDKDKDGDYKYSLEVNLKFKGVSEKEALIRRLENLGYIYDPRLTEISDILRDFKLRFRLPKDLNLEDIIDLHDKDFKDIQARKKLFDSLVETESDSSSSTKGVA
jgi:hypothetical protein